MNRITMILSLLCCGMAMTARNIFNRAYQSHLSRLKYCDVNTITGHQGVYNPGRNIVLKVVVPVTL